MSKNLTSGRDINISKQQVFVVKPIGSFVLLRQIITIPKLMISNPTAKVLKEYEYNAEYYVVAVGPGVANVSLGDKVSPNDSMLMHSKYEHYKDSYSLDNIKGYINELKADDRARFWKNNNDTVTCHNYFIGLEQSLITAILDDKGL